MRTKLLIAALVIMLPVTAKAAGAEVQQTSYLAFVTEYIRELGKMEHLRLQAGSELTDGSDRIVGCVRNMTRFQLELRTQMYMLRGMHLKPPFDRLAPSLAEFDEQKLQLYGRLGDGCEALMVGPKPGVDYGAIAVEAPKINAQLEYIDKAMFEATPMIFMTLIDPVPDANDHMSKLIITSQEREKLIADIDLAFGAELEKTDQNYTVSAASVLKAYLGKEKGYTSSDEARQQKR